MRRSRFTDSQILDVVKRVEAGIGVPDLCRDMGISTATFYKWRAKYGGMDMAMMSRMKVYLSAYDSFSAARKDIAQYMDWYNDDRPHSSLNDRTPTEVWLESLLPLKEAA
jgi:putative transposase